MSTKAVMQQMRASRKVGANITFTESMSVTMKNDTFSSNPNSKRRSLLMLSKAPQNVGWLTYHQGDADLLIAKTTVKSAQSNTAVLVGGDTDLLVLLCSS